MMVMTRCMVLLLCACWLFVCVNAGSLSPFPFQGNWTAYGIGTFPSNFMQSVSSVFIVPSNAGSSFATYSFVTGLSDEKGNFFGSRLFWDGTVNAWKASGEGGGPDVFPIGGSSALAIQPGDQLFMDYTIVDIEWYSIMLTNLKSGQRLFYQAQTTAFFDEYYFAFDNAWAQCGNYPKEGALNITNFDAICYSGHSDCTTGVTWTTGVVQPVCKFAAHVDQSPSQLSITWATQSSASDTM
jgi:hypothetical protein